MAGFHGTWCCILAFCSPFPKQGGCSLYSTSYSNTTVREMRRVLRLVIPEGFSRYVATFDSIPSLSSPLFPFLSLPRPVPYSLLQEILVLDRLVYRNRSQHRTAKYFTLALEVRRAVYLGTQQWYAAVWYWYVFLGAAYIFRYLVAFLLRSSV